MRIISVPPLMVLALLLILWFHGGVFDTVSELVWGIVCLTVLPALAYPLSKQVPAWREAGRDKQRKLAFVFSIVGYTALMVYGFVGQVGTYAMLIFATYFFGLAVLVVINKVIKRKASGHACSITGPLVLLVYFIGWQALIPCAALFALIMWSSVVLKRHTPKEFALGALSCAIGFFISLVAFVAPTGTLAAPHGAAAIATR